MKKVFSLMLSLVMIVCVTMGDSISTFADAPTVIDLGQSVDGEAVEPVYYEFSVPASGKVILNLYGTTYSDKSEYGIDYYLYDSVTAIGGYDYIYDGVASYNEAFDQGIGQFTFNLVKGTYYLMIEPYYYCNSNYYNYNFNLEYSPNISAPITLKVSTRNRTSLKLSWTGVSNADGYKLQQKIDGTWKTKVTTSSRYTTISNLTPGKNYYFRVRAYINVDGKNYYSLGRTLTTCTKPATVTLSGLSRYSSGHKIKATWKKVSGYASGYQIYWSRNSSFSNVVAKTTVSGQSTTSYTGKNFTKGRRYYVKVRAYKTVNGTKHYGSWSNVKSIVCK